MNTYFQKQILDLTDTEYDSEGYKENFEKFIEDQAYQPMSESLIQATIEQLGDVGDFISQYDCISSNGANGGYNGFIYSADIEEFVLNNKADILALAKNQADDLGIDSAFAMISGFNCLKAFNLTSDDIAEALYDKDSDYRAVVIDALGWYVLEEACYKFKDFLERLD